MFMRAAVCARHSAYVAGLRQFDLHEARPVKLRYDIEIVKKANEIFHKVSFLS